MTMNMFLCAFAILIMCCRGVLPLAADEPGAEEGSPAPQHLAELLPWLDRVLPAATIAEISAAAGPGGMIQYHFSVGMWLRNELGLWGDGPLSNEIRARLRHPDADYMSALILSWYWFHRQGRQAVLPTALGQQPSAADLGGTWDAAAIWDGMTLPNGTTLAATTDGSLQVDGVTTPAEMVVLRNLCAAYAHGQWPRGQVLLLSAAESEPHWQLRRHNGTWESLPHDQQSISIVTLEPQTITFEEWRGGDDGQEFGHRWLSWSVDPSADESLTIEEWRDDRAWDMATWPQRPAPVRD